MQLSYGKGAPNSVPWGPEDPPEALEVKGEHVCCTRQGHTGVQAGTKSWPVSPGAGGRSGEGAGRPTGPQLCRT